ncbi:glycosyltransferase involved in cell wall biosynthesis [Flavobacterium sp. 7E]|uniref:glycosyltransferase family 4 protein n=1 Tax=Flavobacterium sp. 7E TaxID=2735898 RepID=UPI00156E8916|nr:glycosyltransferase family 1 protein [Flavobacterium sp. 7E]NRS90149.1 glycosyltransferase involved in cell wall biosynthesis [Flavobacterium sp. 7E]
MINNKKVIIGIDASRNRSGGAKAHVIGLISDGTPEDYGIDEVHIWAFKSLLDSLPDKPWLFKHNPEPLEKSLFKQIYWQAFTFQKELISKKVTILFTTDASTFCSFKPMVVMSQDLIQYEPGIMKIYGWGMGRLSNFMKLVVQNRAMRRAKGVIFLTEYSMDTVQQTTGMLDNKVVIPHGVGSLFKEENHVVQERLLDKKVIKCIYVSNTEMYKHQWNVVKAVASLREKGIPIELVLAGGGIGKSRILLDQEILNSDPHNNFVKILEFISPLKMPNLLSNSDISIFASSCENLPVTLLESMAVGLPIASSNRGPMPEVLKEAGIYFNPEDYISIALAVEKLIKDDNTRILNAKRGRELSLEYSWNSCSNKTWDYLVKISNSI